jgi:hypothetical protein
MQWNTAEFATVSHFTPIFFVYGTNPALPCWVLLTHIDQMLLPPAPSLCVPHILPGEFCLHPYGMVPVLDV